MNYNEKDIKAHYQLLNHKNETEIRTINRETGKVESYFVIGESKFIEKCKEISCTEFDCYFGLNERKSSGTMNKDVISFCGFAADIEGDNHDIGLKSKAKELTDLFAQDLNKNNIKTNIYDTGRGYRIQVTFVDSYLIHNDNERTKVEKIIAQIRKYFAEEFSVIGAHVDLGTFDLARVFRVCGTENKASKTVSYWVDIQGKTEPLIFKNWCEILPAPIEKKTTANAQIPKTCSFLEMALKKPFPVGDRHKRLSPNMARYLETKENQKELKEKYYAIQWSADGTKNKIKDLERWPLHEFNCPSLQKYATDLGHYKETCLGCQNRKLLLSNLKEMYEASDEEQYVANQEAIDFSIFKKYFGKVKHLTNWELIDSLFPLPGEQYLGTKKLLAYQINSTLQPPIRFNVGVFSFDNRIHVLIFTLPGGGKSTIQNGFNMYLKKVIKIKDAGYASHVEQFKGTLERIKRGKGKNATEENKEHPGLLAESDLLLIDEGFEILNETTALNGETMRVIRKACDTFNENEISKPQVLHEVPLSFNSYSRLLCSCHPKKFSSSIFINSGTYRRFFASEIQSIDINIKDSTNGLKLKITLDCTPIMES